MRHRSREPLHEVLHNTRPSPMSGVGIGGTSSVAVMSTPCAHGLTASMVT